MTRYENYWRSNKEWYTRDKWGVCTINLDAPKEAQESYKLYRQQKAEHERIKKLHGYE